MRAPVKALFVNINGEIYAENLPRNKRVIEYPDGGKAFFSQGVYYDADHRGPPIIVYWYGRNYPEGVNLSHDQEAALIDEMMEVASHKFHYPVSKMWVRFMVRWLMISFKLIGASFLMAFAMLTLWAVSL